MGRRIRNLYFAGLSRRLEFIRDTGAALAARGRLRSSADAVRPATPRRFAAVVEPDAIINAKRIQCEKARVRRPVMLDLIVLALGGGFFAASILYAHVCDRL